VIIIVKKHTIAKEQKNKIKVKIYINYILFLNNKQKLCNTLTDGEKSVEIKNKRKNI
jgi:hypothetical protein